MDASGVRPGADQVEKTVRDMAQTISAEGAKAGQGVERIGDGAKRGADATQRETGRMIAAVQRLQAETAAGGRNTAAYFDEIARLRGLDADRLRPYIDGLRAAESAQKAAAKSLDGIGVSAKQTTAALRQVPAQFTDIVTSLASGQQPLTVLLQQGGQLKDVFGGAGAAARALGGYVLGLINPFTVLAAAAAAAAYGFVAGSREAQEYARVLVLSGNAAGVTADQLSDMARAVASVGQSTQGRAAEVLAQIAASGDVGASSLQRFTQAAIEFERAGGQAAEETAKAFTELARDPLQASLKLAQGTNYLTTATAEHIKALQEQGRHVEAARAAQDAYADAIEARTPQLVARLGYVERAWLAVKDAAKAAGDAIKEVGRADTTGTQINVLRQRIEAIQAGRARTYVGEQAQLQAQLRALEQGSSYEALSAYYQGEQARLRAANVQWLKEGEKYLSATKRLEQEVLRIRQEGEAAGRPEREIAERIAAAVDRAPKPPKAREDNTAERERERTLAQQARLLAELSGVTATYVQDLGALDAMRRAGLLTEQRYVELVQELISRQPAVRQQAQASAKAAEDEARAVAKSAREHEQRLATIDREVDASQRTLRQMRLELIELTAGKQARQEVEQLERERLALAYEQAAIEESADADAQERYRRLAEQLREEIRLRREVATAAASAEVAKENERAAKDAEREWERAADQIGQSLADAIFKGGKDAGDLLADYFRTLVLKPIIEASMRPIVDALGSAFGLKGPAASGVGGAGGAGGTLGSFGSLASSINLGSLRAYATALGTNIAAISLGRTLGSGISNGYSVNGGSGNSAVNVGTAIGTAFGGPIGAVIGGAVGGLANRLFGRKLTDSGFEGSFGAGGDFGGNQFEYLKGGLLRSSKVQRSPLDSSLEAVLDAGGRAAMATAQQYAQALGLPVAALEGFSRQIKVSLKGLSEEQAKQAIQAVVADYQTALLGRFNAQLEPLRRVGETLAQTIERIIPLQEFGRAINVLGGVFSRVAGLAIDAREELLAMAGGIDTLTQQSLSYVQQYYSREEIAGLKARDVQQVLLGAGITGDVNTRDQFRALVDNTDVGTAEGRARLAQLLGVSGDFAAVADYLAETGGTLSGVAAQAPATGALADLFAQPQAEQVQAINTVAYNVTEVRDAIDRLAEVMRDQYTVTQDGTTVWEIGSGA